MVEWKHQVWIMEIYIYIHGNIALNSVSDRLAVIILNFTSRLEQMDRVEEVINIDK